MKPVVESALEELQTNVILLKLGRDILDTLIVFVVIFLFSTIFNFSAYYALIPAAVYFFIRIGITFYKSKYIDVEEKVPELKEQLRTVADNIYRTNPIIDSLKEDVVKNIGRVRTSSFIDTNTITIRILVLTLFSIVVVVLSFLNVNFDARLGFGFLGGPDIQKARFSGDEVIDLNLSYMEGNLTDILGQGSIARLGNKELQLLINPLASDADVGNFKKVKEQDFNPPSFPKEIYTSYDVAYSEKIAKENQNVVKKYFEKITEGL